MEKNTVVPTLLVVLAFVTLCNPWTGTADGAKILAVEMFEGKSHWNVMSAILRSLTDAGHHVTVFTPSLDGDRANYTEIDISGHLPRLFNNDSLTLIGQFSQPTTTIRLGCHLTRILCNAMYEDDRFLQVLETGPASGFDAIIVEPTFFDCVSRLAHTLDLPIIYMIPFPIVTLSERKIIRHLSNPAFVPQMFGIGPVPCFTTFLLRLINVWQLVQTTILGVYYQWTIRLADPRPYDQSPTVNPSIVFLNSHYITDVSRPMPPNVVDISGIHLGPANIIPKDILEFIENSPYGVIYFTFGSIVTFSTLPEPIVNAFKEAFSRVPQRVLWKYEEEMADKPENVMISKWFPQRDVLLHPNIKLFISHGGISGVLEAIDAGVPVLGFPLFFDQHRNIDHLVYNGMAIPMDLLSITADKLFDTISELINNEKYSRNAKINSEQFKDRPMTPQQSVVYWTEYVIRHKGAPHLRSNGYNLTWYQYFLLDVMAVVLVSISVVLFVIYRGSKFVYKRVLQKTNKVSEQ